MVLKRRADRNGQVGGFDQTLTRAISIEPLLGLRCGVGQVCLGAFSFRSPEAGDVRRRGCSACSPSMATGRIFRPRRLDFSRITSSNNLKFQISIRRLLTVSDSKAARAAGRPELEALGG
jgi:hypothetical protein